MKEQVIFKSVDGQKAILAGYESFLSRWPVPYERLELNTSGGRTFLLACGERDAPGLILLHGSGSNSAMWAGDIAALAGCFRVYAVDIPGEPGLSEPRRADLKGQGVAGWLYEIFTGLGLSRASLIGISLGGFMALKFATAYPECVEKLVLLCPSGLAMQKTSFMLKAIPLSFLGRWGFERISSIVNGRQPIHEQALDYSWTITQNFNPRMEVIPLLSDEELLCLSMPILYIAGEKDALLPSNEAGERLNRLLPSAQVQILPGAPHLLINQSGRILPFLKK